MTTSARRNQEITVHHSTASTITLSRGFRSDTDRRLDIQTAALWVSLTFTKEEAHAFAAALGKGLYELDGGRW